MIQPFAGNDPQDQREGLLLVGHGTRDVRGVAEFLETAELVGRLAPRVEIAPCFLEMVRPTIAEGIVRLASLHVRRITVVPLLLFAAGHAKWDIPRAIRAAAELAPHLPVWQAPPLGCHEEIVRLSVERFEAAIGQAPPLSLTETLLLLVGRGSRDRSAAAEMRQFAECRRAHTPVGGLRIGFLSMARPSLEEAIQAAGAEPFRRVVVQPHLLFHGELLGKMRAAVERAAAEFPHQQWMTTDHLGPSRRIAEAVLDRGMLT